MLVSPLIASYAMISNMLILYWLDFVSIRLIQFIIHSSFWCLHFYCACVSIYFFNSCYVTHVAVLWNAFDWKMILSTFAWANCTKVIGKNWIVCFELNIVLSMKANCCFADVQYMTVYVNCVWYYMMSCVIVLKFYLSRIL